MEIKLCDLGLYCMVGYSNKPGLEMPCGPRFRDFRGSGGLAVDLPDGSYFFPAVPEGPLLLSYCLLTVLVLILTFYFLSINSS